MGETVMKYMQSKDRLMKYFGCKENYFIKPLPNAEWQIEDSNDFPILSYSVNGEPKIDALICKKNGKPLIFSTKGYTMVIAIECIKIAFVFKNDKRITLNTDEEENAV